MNLKPELVEKKDPPIIINNKKINENSFGVFSTDKPMFETLLEIDKNIKLKSRLLSVNTKNVAKIYNK